MNLLLALFCVFLFSLTAPFTRIAALETTPEAIILLRVLGAGLICGAFTMMDKWIPPRKAWKGIAFTALGSVIGFNSLMAYGLSEVPAGHAAVALACLPIATSTYSSIRDRSNPGLRFWLFALAGTLFSLSFFFSLNVTNLLKGDFLLLLAVLSAAFGYVEGGRTSRKYGGTRIMSWSVLLTLPVIIPVAIYHFKFGTHNLSMSFSAWLSVGYLALVSQSLGMFLWFKVLARGPMEKVALMQLLQPFLTFTAAIILLNEKVLFLTWIIAAIVAFCVMGSSREKKFR